MFLQWPQTTIAQQTIALQDYPTLMFFSLGGLILAVFNDLQAVRARNMRVIR